MVDRTVLSNFVVMIIRSIDSYGCDGRAVAESAGIDYELAKSPESRISARRVQDLMHKAVAVTGDPCFGLTITELIQPAALHGLGLGFLVSDSLRNALQRLVRFQRLLSTNLSMDLITDEDRYLLVIGTRDTSIVIAPTTADFAYSLIIKLCRLTLEPSVAPAAVRTRRQRPPCADRIEDFLGCTVEFGATENVIVFDRDVLDQILPHANPLLARVNDQIVVDYLARFDRDNIVTRMRSIVIEQLPSGRPNQETVARAMNMSIRALQRRLHDHGTSFRELLEDVRRELAESYLREPHRSIAEISYLLGFTEPANFTRSFREWKGVVPTKFRESVAAGSSR